jgi:hypothetical protein
MNVSRRSVLGGGLAGLAGVVMADGEGEKERLRWRLVPEGWGVAVEADVKAVLGSVVGELWRYFPERRLEPLVIRRGRESPIVHYQRSALGEIVVELNTQDRFWCQYAYQFSHEFCHVLSGFEDDWKGNQWLEESFCECASLFVLRRLAVTWAKNPPYASWQGYAVHFREYADDVMRGFEAVPDAGIAEYVRKHREAMEKQGTDRTRNGVVAVALLRQLETAPQYWEAVSWLNSKPAPKGETLEESLGKWLRASPERVRPFIVQTAKLLGVRVGSGGG